MKLFVEVTLDSGGTVTVTGEDLSAEDVNEVFAILSGYTVESVTTPESIDEPLPTAVITESMKEGFVEGFNEARQGEQQ